MTKVSGSNGCGEVQNFGNLQLCLERPGQMIEDFDTDLDLHFIPLQI